VRAQNVFLACVRASAMENGLAVETYSLTLVMLPLPRMQQTARARRCTEYVQCGEALWGVGYGTLW